MSSTAVASGRLYLIDAHAYLHRAYHALPPLTNSSGEPVGALYGFARMLLGIAKREKPEFVAVCFDSPGPTFRHEAFKDYKGTRKEIDEDLKSQLAQARPLAEGLGFKCAERPGYEADDLMATMAARARAEGLDVVLVTTDKDAFQLVNDHIRVLHEGKGLFFNAGKVREKYGVEPEQIADYLALVGDVSDNVPGVPGIGPVGAAKLLNRFGGLEALVKAAEAGDADVPAKAAQSIRNSADQLALSRRLVELNAQAPLELNVLDCRPSEEGTHELLPLLRRYEFNTLIKEMFPEAESGPRTAGLANVGAVTVTAAAEPAIELPAWLKAASHAKRISLAWLAMPRLELLGDATWTLALGLPDGRCAFAGPEDLKKSALTRLLAGVAEKVGHDLKAVFTALRREGVESAGPIFDTMLAAYCLNPAAKYDFDSVARQYAGDLGAETSDPSHRALLQARLAWPLAERLETLLREQGFLKLYQEWEIPLLEVLSRMEADGIAVDGPYLKRLRSEFETRIAEMKSEIDKTAGVEVNLHSPKQLAKLLFEDLKLPVIHKTPKGGPSTDEEALSALSALHPLPAKIIDYREMTKLLSTYVDGLLERTNPRTGRVHTHFNQAGTSTGRLSSVDPNLQNIPVRTVLGRKIRRAFIPSKGNVLVSADYSQIDLRVLAHLSEDPALTEAFRSGEDVHLRTACEIFDLPADRIDKEMRRKAKAVNFGIVYGQTAHGLSRELGIPMGQAKEYIDRYFRRYAGVARWIRATLEAARQEGSVRTMLGRVRYLPDLSAKNTALRQFNERVAVNTPIQGSSADIIKVAMVHIQRTLASERRWKSKMVLQVHDELVFDVPRSELKEFGSWARREMEKAISLKVPLVVDVKAGEDWEEMEPLS